MRKRLKRKRRACGLCKPWKRGLDNRWKAKDQAAEAAARKDIAEVLR